MTTPSHQQLTLEKVVEAVRNTAATTVLATSTPLHVARRPPSTPVHARCQRPPPSTRTLRSASKSSAVSYRDASSSPEARGSVLGKKKKTGKGKPRQGSGLQRRSARTQVGGNEHGDGDRLECQSVASSAWVTVTGSEVEVEVDSPDGTRTPRASQPASLSPAWDTTLVDSPLALRADPCTTSLAASSAHEVESEARQVGSKKVFGRKTSEKERETTFGPRPFQCRPSPTAILDCLRDYAFGQITTVSIFSYHHQALAVSVGECHRTSTTTSDREEVERGDGAEDFPLARRLINLRKRLLEGSSLGLDTVKLEWGWLRIANRPASATFNLDEVLRVLNDCTPHKVAESVRIS